MPLTQAYTATNDKKMEFLQRTYQTAMPIPFLCNTTTLPQFSLL